MAIHVLRRSALIFAIGFSNGFPSSSLPQSLSWAVLPRIGYSISPPIPHLATMAARNNCADKASRVRANLGVIAGVALILLGGLLAIHTFVPGAGLRRGQLVKRISALT